jgi:hypothetical protein
MFIKFNNVLINLDHATKIDKASSREYHFFYLIIDISDSDKITEVYQDVTERDERFDEIAEVLLHEFNVMKQCMMEKN